MIGCSDCDSTSPDTCVLETPVLLNISVIILADYESNSEGNPRRLNKHLSVIQTISYNITTSENMQTGYLSIGLLIDAARE